MGRAVHLVIRMLAGAVALVLLVIALLAARLAAGSLSLDVLTPVLESAIDAFTPYHVRIGGAGMLWQSWQRGLLMHLNDVRLSSSDADVSGNIGDLAVAFSADAFARGVLAPSSIEASGTMLRVETSIDGLRSDAFGAAGDSGNPVERVFAELRSPPNAERPLSYLSALRLHDVAIDVVLDRSRPVWSVRVTDAEFNRDSASAMTGHASLRLSRAGENDATIAVEFARSDGAGLNRGYIDFSGVRPAAFADLAPTIAAFSAIDARLDGRISLDLTANGTLADAVVTVASGPGAIAFDAQLSRATGLPLSEQRLPVRSVVLHANLDPPHDRYVLERGEIAFQPGATLQAPEPIDHSFPISSLSVTGSYENRRLTLSSLDADLDGLRVTATASIDAPTVAASGSATVAATNVKVNDFRRYWPPKAAPGAYVWCTEHLRDGIVPEVQARLTWATHDGSTEVTALNAEFGVQRLTVDYLPPMPAVRRVSGRARVDLKTMTIDVTGGQAAGLNVRGGTISFPDLERDVPSIDIDLTVAGPVRDAVALIAHQPLAYPQKLGLSAAQTSGEMTMRLALGFPLLARLKIEEIDARAQADLNDAGIAGVAPGIDLTDGQMRLDVDTSSLHAAGRIAVAGIPGRLDATESFVDRAQPRTRIELAADDVSVARLRQSIPEVSRLEDYLIGGSFSGSIRAAFSDEGAGLVESTLDLRNTHLALPYLRWEKQAGRPGTIDVAAQMFGQRLAAVSHLSVIAPDLEVRGSSVFRDDGSLEHLVIDRLVCGRTDLSATVARLPAADWDVMISGASLDLASVLKAVGESSTANASNGSQWPTLTFAADVKSVWLGGATPISDVMATLVHRERSWPLVQMQGHLTDGSSLELAIAPTDDHSRSFSASAENAGEALRAFRIFSDMTGGRMETRGRFDDSDPAHPLRARLRVRDYHIINAPILARMLSILALTGIRDALTGRGISFSTLDMPFTVRKGVLSIDNGKAYGSSLGLTFAGAVDTDAEAIDLQGQLVPFYAVNSAIGHVPLLGDVMTGGEDGGGLFSASYRVTGPLDDPKISVNPVSVLFPSFLRWVLDTFQGWITGSSGIDNGG